MQLPMRALEAVVDYSCARRAARGNDDALSPPVCRLAGVYALMMH